MVLVSILKHPQMHSIKPFFPRPTFVNISFKRHISFKRRSFEQQLPSESGPSSLCDFSFLFLVYSIPTMGPRAVLRLCQTLYCLRAFAHLLHLAWNILPLVPALNSLRSLLKWHSYWRTLRPSYFKQLIAGHSPRLTLLYSS